MKNFVIMFSLFVFSGFFMTNNAEAGCLKNLGCRAAKVVKVKPVRSVLKKCKLGCGKSCGC